MRKLRKYTRLLFRIMQRTQRKRSAPSWLKENPYIKVRFTQDGITSKVTESCKLKLEEKGRPLTGSLSNYSFRVGQKVWCYWKTADEKEKHSSKEKSLRCGMMLQLLKRFCRIRTKKMGLLKVRDIFTL